MLRSVRLFSGLVLFAYVFVHLVNHGIGIYSLSAMEAARPYLQAPFGNPVGQVLLYGAMAVHIALGLYGIAHRRTFRTLPRGEIIQIVSGLAIPPLLVLHVIGTRVIATFYGAEPNYPWLLLIYFEYDTTVGWRQMAVLAVAWVHGCLGLYYWLSVKKLWASLARFALLPAVLMPVMAYAGAWSAGREVAAFSLDPGFEDTLFQTVKPPSWDVVETLYRVEDWFLVGYAALVVAVFLYRECRRFLERRRGMVEVVFNGKRVVHVPEGTSVLEACRLNSLAHASVCGGRGRCSTCRVRVLSGFDFLNPPSSGELAVLSRINAAPDVRLACQLRPGVGVVNVSPLLPPTASARDGFARPGYLQGEEVEIAVLFADIRNFTALSKAKLPYDVVFLLNRYSEAVGQAIEETGGYLDKFVGDGVMALFGVGQDDRVAAARQALDAARLIGERVAALNASLAMENDEPLKVGIGVHAGTAIVGEMGYGRSVQMTAIGDTVNIASRLEELTKQFGTPLVVSGDVAEMCGLPRGSFTESRVDIRGRNEDMRVCAVADLTQLRTDA